MESPSLKQVIDVIVIAFRSFPGNDSAKSVRSGDGIRHDLVSERGGATCSGGAFIVIYECNQA